MLASVSKVYLEGLIRIAGLIGLSGRKEYGMTFPILQ